MIDSQSIPFALKTGFIVSLMHRFYGINYVYSRDPHSKIDPGEQKVIIKLLTENLKIKKP